MAAKILYKCSKQMGAKTVHNILHICTVSDLFNNREYKLVSNLHIISLIVLYWCSLSAYCTMVSIIFTASMCVYQCGRKKTIENPEIASTYLELRARLHHSIAQRLSIQES